MLTEAQIKIVAHTLGVDVHLARTSVKKRDKKLPKDFYQNRFCTSEGHSDLPVIEELQGLGYMEPFAKINQGTSTLWWVTEAGESIFRKMTIRILYPNKIGGVWARVT